MWPYAGCDLVTGMGMRVYCPRCHSTDMRVYCPRCRRWRAVEDDSVATIVLDAESQEAARTTASAAIAIAIYSVILATIVLVRGSNR